jgi:hypothetical protein
VKIRGVTPNNRRKAFQVRTGKQSFSYPYARLRLRPTRENGVSRVFVDPELGNEAFTYTLEDGREDSVHMDEVLEYNQDPEYLRELLVYRLTLEAQKRVAGSGLSKREIIRRLGTSPAQLYRLLDQTNTRTSIGQLVALLHVLDCDVELSVKEKAR